MTPSLRQVHTFFSIFTLMLLSCNQGTRIDQDTTAAPPNLIIILADDLGYADVGFNGSTEILTPNIDRIATNGVTFTNGYVSYAVCGPSRAGLITGRYQDRFGFGRNPLFTPNDPGQGLPLSEETLATVLGKAGYRSAAIGKWHLGAHASLHPLKRGFTDFFGFLSGGHRYFPEEWDLADEFEAKQQYDGYRTKLLRNHERIEESEYLTDALSREAVHYIEKYQDDPFFIYLAYNAPHSPMQATDKYLDRYPDIDNKKRKTYAAMVSAVDDGVGLVLSKLESLGLSEKTIVVFLSDNGGPEHVNASDNGALRGKKGDLFEGGIRVPFAMQWPGQIPAGMQYDHPIISLDIFATIINQGKKAIPTKNPIDGVDLVPYLNGKKTDSPHPILYWRKFDQKRFAVRMGKDKLLQKSPEERMLFDLDLDIGEENDQLNRNNQLTDKLLQKFNTWESQLTDPIFLGLMHNKEYDKNHPDRFKRPE